MIDPSVNTHCDQNGRDTGGAGSMNPGTLNFDPECPKCGCSTGREGLPGLPRWTLPQDNQKFLIGCFNCGCQLRIKAHLFAKYSATVLKKGG